MKSVKSVQDLKKNRRVIPVKFQSNFSFKVLSNRSNSSSLQAESDRVVSSKFMTPIL